MKKTALAVLVTGLLSTSAMADTIAGLYIGGSIWSNEATGTFGEQSGLVDFNLQDKEQGSFYIALEHPIPLIPNLMITSTTLDTDGATVLLKDFDFSGKTFDAGTAVDSTFDISYVDYTLYYEIFDNGLFSFDIGLTGRDFDGDITVSADSLSGTLAVTEVVPMLYVSTIVGLPGTSFNLFANGNLLSIDDHTIYDYQVGVSYELIDNLAVDVNLTLGYKAVKFELEDLDDLYTNIEFKGAFAGVVVHF
ncbi:TIGR04219 family outer membrane beta-barrel protein [Colwellia hornerae]|uniref:TIGR04219 family outer membrane beta-barrel protein n=1 Tax=Colwellia hornerae TaxID=89402 RepID=A0A5C6QG44_9GAMM|nr:TIGR04219 family outer membrane beta-barrel protein [Colwellia hornerae]TWX55240.1 TIGR04219 family outer membrane beta-barrel protein [Colwellia hornerae]TWX61240.1 TIGR04219 family outer membrane beta-barrel protein [Colwellia hornerae]TWX67713.1 TIGR04219 family outer membrane beta-barrel protein [Colwellia hornerae]